VQLLVQPEDGVFPVLKAIRKARRSIDIYIFRLAYKDIEKALHDAVARGVEVRTLISHTRGSGEKGLRKLEQRLLEMGATVSRTADDLLRYHGKAMIVDRTTLYVFAFNFARVDIDRSRSLGLATRKRELVLEALRLFEADFNRKNYTSGARSFVVSPVNARSRLEAYLRGARKELLIYDSGLTDNGMIKILKERQKAGVDLRIIGKVEKGHEGISAESLTGKRQHLRAIVRDRRTAFIGSQSLRKLELDARREIGVLIGNLKVVQKIVEVFEADWAKSATGESQAKKDKDKDKGKGKGKAKQKPAAARAGHIEARQ
jgi:phosphatidylserine/phosphatidylglycerophosphate/cardiolipin synthase-like enzyme